MKKNILIGLIAVTLCFSLVGCGDNSGGAVSVESSTAIKESSVDSTEETENQKDDSISEIDLTYVRYSSAMEAMHNAMINTIEFENTLIKNTYMDDGNSESLKDTVTQTYNAFKTQLEKCYNDKDKEKMDLIYKTWVDYYDSSNTSMGKIGQAINDFLLKYSDNILGRLRESDEYNTLLYEDEKVKIYFYKLSESGVHFKVENLTDIALTVQANSVSINGKSTNNIIMSENIAPQSTGEAVAKCDDFADVKEIETVGGSLHVFDSAYKSNEKFDATFVNVPVEEE